MNKLKTVLNKYTSDKRLTRANSDDTLMPFLHGLKINYRSMSPYIFINNTPTNMTALLTRNFEEYPNIDDPVLNLGNILYNKKFNLLFVLIPQKKWNLVNTCIDIAEASTKDLVSKSKIVLNSMEILSKLEVKEIDQ